MKVKFFVACLYGVIAFSSHGASLGTYRIYLDEDTTKQKFAIRNRSNVPETCQVSFKNRRFDGQGNLIELSPEQQEMYSEAALSRFRYSPKTFTVAPNTTQYVAFSYRRKPGDVENELRTYPAFLCQKERNNELGQGNFGAVLELSVPLIIRTGKVDRLDANLDLLVAQKTDKVIKVQLEHSGARSVYGDISLVNKQGELVQMIRKNAVVYPDMGVLNIDLPIQTAGLPNVYLQFKEKDNFSGAKTFKWEI